MNGRAGHLKVFYVIDHYDGPSGGTGKQLLILIRQMVELGHEVRLFVLRDTEYTRSAPDFPCPIECLSVGAIRSFASLRRMRAFRARLLAEHPDVVHAFFNDAAILIPLHCWRTGAIVVTSRRDMGFWYSAFNLPLLRLANRYVDRIVCNSESVAREVVRRERTRSSKLVVIYNALPINEQPREAPAHVNESETGTTSTKHAEIRVCLLANLRPIKRMEDFIKAAAMVAEQVPDCRFLIIGESLSSSYEASLRRLAEDLSLQDRLEFTGLISDPQRLLDSCQIGVLTSESEGLSNAILEYMAMGLPVICSNVGGNAELVQHGHNGFLYPCGDAKALADRLRRLCTDAAERRRMGAASRERARSFSTERMVQSHLRAYLGSREHADG